MALKKKLTSGSNSAGTQCIDRWWQQSLNKFIPSQLHRKLGKGTGLNENVFKLRVCLRLALAPASRHRHAQRDWRSVCAASVNRAPRAHYSSGHTVRCEGAWHVLACPA
eukprot:16152727-Heterocapsa_arctica.AAC.1